MVVYARAGDPCQHNITLDAVMLRQCIMLVRHYLNLKSTLKSRYCHNTTIHVTCPYKTYIHKKLKRIQNLIPSPLIQRALSFQSIENTFACYKRNYRWQFIHHHRQSHRLVKLVQIIVCKFSFHNLLSNQYATYTELDVTEDRRPWCLAPGFQCCTWIRNHSRMCTSICSDVSSTQLLVILYQSKSVLWLADQKYWLCSDGWLLIICNFCRHKGILQYIYKLQRVVLPILSTRGLSGTTFVIVSF